MTQNRKKSRSWNSRILKFERNGGNQLENRRKIKSKINLDEEIEILIQKETDRQLNQYSINFFNKLKKNIFIYEL